MICLIESEMDDSWRGNSFPSRSTTSTRFWDPGTPALTIRTKLLIPAIMPPLRHPFASPLSPLPPFYDSVITRIACIRIFCGQCGQSHVHPTGIPGSQGWQGLCGNIYWIPSGGAWQWCIPLPFPVLAVASKTVRAMLFMIFRWQQWWNRRENFC